jgi:hypothetical protein
VVPYTDYWTVLTQEEDVYLSGPSAITFYPSTSSSLAPSASCLLSIYVIGGNVNNCNVNVGRYYDQQCVDHVLVFVVRGELLLAGGHLRLALARRYSLPASLVVTHTHTATRRRRRHD